MFILINKPSNISSHDVIEKLRKITGIKKIGHAGTLDPLATGLLIVGISRNATKQLLQFQKLDKEYVAKIRLGAVSKTFDKEGEIEERKIERIPKLEEIKKILKNFIGEIEQIPPLFSAKKIKGKKAYQLARKGVKFDLEPVKIKIYDLKILKYLWPYLEIKVSCSSGTYIRSLANDIGEKLGCGGYLEELKRTKIGNFSLKKSIPLEKINSENWKSFCFLKNETKINENTSLAEILKLPGAEEILSKYRLPCLSCPLVKMEIEKLKIGEVCKIYGINKEKLINELNEKIKGIK